MADLHHLPRLPKVGVDGFQQLVVHLFRRFLIGTAKCLRGTMPQMVAHQISGDAAQGFLNASDLHDDVRAIAVVFQHSLEPANLSFDAPQPFAIGDLQLRVDARRLSPAPMYIAGAIRTFT